MYMCIYVYVYMYMCIRLFAYTHIDFLLVKIIVNAIVIFYLFLCMFLYK